MPRPTFKELYLKYRQRKIPRWAYVLYFLALCSLTYWLYHKFSPCNMNIGAHTPCSECSQQSQPAKPKIIRVF